MQLQNKEAVDDSDRDLEQVKPSSLRVSVAWSESSPEPLASQSGQNDFEMGTEMCETLLNLLT